MPVDSTWMPLRSRDKDLSEISDKLFPVGTLTEADRQATQGSWNWRDVAASATVLLVIIAAHLYFSGAATE